MGQSLKTDLANKETARANLEAENAKASAKGEREQKEEARGNLYVARMYPIQQRWEKGEITQVLDVLQQQVPPVGERDFRHWEWHYQWRLSHAELRTFPGPGVELGRGTRFTSVAFSPDGQLLASGSVPPQGADGLTQVWDLASGREVRRFKSRPVYAVAFSPDGKRLASANFLRLFRPGGPIGGKGTDPPGEKPGVPQPLESGGSVTVWDMASGAELYSRPLAGEVHSLAFSPDGKRLIVGTAVWDATTGKPLERPRIPFTTPISSAALSPDAERLVTVHADGMLKVWDAVSGKQLCSGQGPKEGPVRIAFSPDRQRVATAGEDGTVRVWDATSGQALLTTRHQLPDPKPALRGWDATSEQALRTLRGPTGITSVAFRSDGKILVTADEGGTMRVWDTTSGQELRALKGHTKDITQVAFSADGQRVATASKDGTLKLWDPLIGRQEACTLKAPNNHVLAVSRDGQRVAVTHPLLQRVRLWDTISGQELPKADEGHTHQVLGVAFSPKDANLLASASADSTVKLWDAARGQELRTLKGHTSMVNAVAFCPDGQRLASSCADGTVKVWDTASGKELHTLKGPAGAALSVAFSANGKRLFSVHDQAGKPGTVIVIVWDPASGKQLHALPALRVQTAGVRVWDPASGKPPHTITTTIAAIAVSPTTDQLATASDDKTVKLWDSTSGQLLRTFTGLTSQVYGVAFSSDGKALASGGLVFDQPFQSAVEVKVWDVATGQELRTLKVKALPGRVELIPYGPLLGVTFSPDGQLLASSCPDQTVRLWDVKTGQERAVLKGHIGLVRSVAFSPDGRWLASGGSDTKVKVWDASSGQERHSLIGHARAVRSVAFSPDGQWLAESSDEGTVWLCDSTSGRELRALKGHNCPLIRVAFSPDGKELFSVSQDGMVKRWDPVSGQELSTFKGPPFPSGLPDRPNTLVALSPDGQRLARVTGHKIQMWDVASGQELYTVTGDSESLMCIAFSPDGQRLVSSGSNTVKVWDAANGAELRTLTGHSAGAYCVAFSPDGRRIVSASGDKTIKVWDVATGQELRSLPNMGTRSLAFTPDGQRLVLAGEEGVTLVDGRPWTEPLAVQREALGLLDFLFSKPLPRADVLDIVRNHKGITEAVREQALVLAERFREEDSPQRYAEASRALVRGPSLPAVWYRQALRQAEVAVGLDPRNGAYLTTLGLAQYRLGRYEEALATLTRADRLNATPAGLSTDADLAFLALSHLQLGHHDEARAVLDRLRQLNKQPRAGTPLETEEAQQFLREVEAAIGTDAEGPQGREAPP
jgi:WD40 repeat protein